MGRARGARNSGARRRRLPTGGGTIQGARATCPVCLAPRAAQDHAARICGARIRAPGPFRTRPSHAMLHSIDTSNIALVHRYDEIPYDALPHRATHPSRLASVATFVGHLAPRAESCSLLEVGCNDGANLIPMAVSLPGGPIRRLRPLAASDRARAANDQRAGTDEHRPRRSGPRNTCLRARRVRLHRRAWRVFVGATACARGAVRPRRRTPRARRHPLREL